MPGEVGDEIRAIYAAAYGAAFALEFDKSNKATVAQLRDCMMIARRRATIVAQAAVDAYRETRAAGEGM